MNNKLLAVTMFVSIAMGAYSAPIYTVLDLNSSLLIENDSSNDSLESDSEKLLALNTPKSKSKKSKQEVEEDEVEDEDVDVEEFDDEEAESDSENEGDDSDSDDDESTSALADSDDDDDDDSGSNGGGFGDIKSKLEDKNSTLPESKSDFHVHKNAPHNTVTNKLDPQGSVQEYITYLYGDEIILTHKLIFNSNGTYNINAHVNTNYKTMTPASVVSNTIQSGHNWITEFTFFGGKIITTFTLTPLGNNRWKIDYKWKMIDPNI